MRVLPILTSHVVLLVFLLFSFTSCDLDFSFLDKEFEPENGDFGTNPNYDRLDEVKKACSSVIASASELKIDDNVIGTIKDKLFFNNGDWEQQGTSAPLLPFNDKPPEMSSVYEHDQYNSSRLKPPYKLVSFKLTDVSKSHLSKRTVAVNGFLYLVITSNLPLATMSRKQTPETENPEFSMWSGHTQLVISFQGIYAESRKNGGERTLCMLGSTMLPSRQPDSSDNQPTLLQDEQILLLLNIPKKASLQYKAIQGEMRSLNSKTSLKYFDKVQITSQLQANARDYEFSPDEIIAKACNPLYPYSDTSISGDIEVYKGADFCTTLKKGTIDAAFVVVPHWKCNGTDEFCSKFGPFASDKQINATDGSFKDVRILMHNIVCVTEKPRGDGGVTAKVSAVFRAFDAPNILFIENQRSGLGNMTLVAEGIWNSSTGQLCMIGCLGVVGVEEIDHCDSRICLYIPLSFSIKQRSILLGSISSIKNSNPPYFPLSLEMLYQSFDYISNGYKYAQPFYHYSKIDDAGTVLEKYEPFNFGTVIKKSLLTFPKLQDSDDYSDSLRLLAEDLTLYVSAVPDPIPVFQPSRTKIEMEVLSLGPMFGHNWFSNDSIDNTPYLTKAAYTEKQLLLNVSTQFKLKGGSYNNFSMLFLEGIYDQHVGRMYLIGCRDVRASWKVLYESITDLENGLDCLIEVVISYPPTTAQWVVTPTVSISISSKRTEDDPFYFKQVQLLTLPIMYRKQRVDILSRSDFEGILKILNLSIATACILSQLFYTRNASDSLLPYMSLVMLGSQVIGYALPLVIGVESLSQNMDSESSSYDLEKSQLIKVIDYTVKLLVLVCLLLTLRLCQKVWTSRIKLLSQSQNSNDPHRVPTEKRVVVVTLFIHVVGYIVALVSHSLKTGQRPTWIEQYVDTTGNPHTLKPWETLFEEYTGLLQDLFLLPQIIGNIIWQINGKPLRKVYYMGITVVRLLPHMYDYIRGPVSNPFFSEEYEFVNRKFDFYSEFGDIAIPVLAIAFAVIVYIQQRWNYEKLRNTLALGKHVLPLNSRMYERVPTQSAEAELVSVQICYA
ncbi:hypothetical protein SOVF_068850 [Spinacia oleracea]|nr:hypothetical protein SOVF_068850 [Spinacia oleracea]